MAVGPASLALGLIVILGLLALESGAARSAGPALRRVALAVLVALGLLAHLGALQGDAGGVALRLPPPHLHEYFHYYLGTKYFDVLGHAGLYEAVLQADRDAAPDAFQPDAPMRDLGTNTRTTRGEAWTAGQAVRERFSTERWAAFERDVAILRDAHPASFWHARGYLHDHGYNGTPLATWLLGSLARHGGETRSFINLMRWVDPYLWLLLGAAIGLQLGATAALTFLAFLFANPLHDGTYVGGAYLRAADGLALAGAWLALRTGALRTAGGLLGFAAVFRVFPVLFAVGLGLHALLRPDRATRLRKRAPLFASFGLSVVGLGLASELAVASPEGGLAWTRFARNLSLHAATPAANQVGWPSLVAYSPAKDHHPPLEGRTSRGPAPAEFDWVQETLRVQDARSGYRWVGAVLWLGLAVLCLRRTSELASALPVMLSLFAITSPSHYYWSILALIPLATEDRRVRIAALLGFAVCALLLWPGGLDARLDLRFALLSGTVGTVLAGACVLGLRRSPWIATSLALLALGCGSSEPAAAPDEPLAIRGPRIEGDRFRSETLGFGFEKPAGWHFLPGSSLIDEADTRVEDRAELWRRLHKPALTPLVGIASAPEPRTGRDAIALIHVIPARANESDFALDVLRKTPMVDAVHTASHARTGPNPNFQVAAPAVAAPFDIGEGAIIDVRYDGEAGPTYERFTAMRRDTQFWYVRVMVPEPVDAANRVWLDSLAASLRFDP